MNHDRQLVIGTEFLRVAENGCIREQPDAGEGWTNADSRALSHFEIKVNGHLPDALNWTISNHSLTGIGYIVTPNEAQKKPRISVEWTLVDNAVAVKVEVRAETGTEPIVLDVVASNDHLSLFALKDHVFGRSRYIDYEQHAIAGGEPVRPCLIHVTPTPNSPPEAQVIGSEAWQGRWSFQGSGKLEAVFEVTTPGKPDGEFAGLSFNELVERRKDSQTAIRKSMAKMTSGPPNIVNSFETAIEDLVSLSIPTANGLIPAAGAPWFLAPFGRDMLITAIQAAPFAPRYLASVLHWLAGRQAIETNDAIDAEPGKILHEVRGQGGTAAWHEIYFGSVDSTPLWLLALEEQCKWSGSTDLANQLAVEAQRAAEWLLNQEEAHGLVSYQRKATKGLDNQSWKDSFDSQRTSKGEFVAPPIAPLEVQGYAVRALRFASEIAEQVWHDQNMAHRTLLAADRLETAITENFWITDAAIQEDDPRHGGWFAQAVGGTPRQPADSLCSNIGHLMWSQIEIPKEMRDAIAEQLMHPSLNSGWGVRTMSSLDAGWDPLSYHCGTVWPHDTSLCIAGLARSGYHSEAEALSHQLLRAAGPDGGRLPEVLSGRARGDATQIPDPYPTTCSPQAWAAGAVLLVISSVLGLDVDASTCSLVTSNGTPPAWLDGTVIDGVQACGKHWSVRVDSDQVRCFPTSGQPSRQIALSSEHQ